MSRAPWTDEEIRWIAEVLSKCTTVVQALAIIREQTGRGVTATNLTNSFRSRGLPSPVEYLLKATPQVEAIPKPPVKCGRPELPEVRERARVEAPGVPPKAEPVDPLQRDRRRLEESQLKREHRDLIDRLKEAEARQAFLDRLGSDTPTPRIERREKKSGLREGTALALASDWHVEEVVYPESVANRNEYNLEIADGRVKQFFGGARSLVEFSRDSWQVRDLVLWLGGDLLSGFIHPELEETNELSPVEAIIWLRQRIVDGIATLLADKKLERLIIPCSYGNHGRTTIKRRIKTGAKNSFEWLLYQWLASHYANEPRITFDAGQSAHQYIDLETASGQRTIHLHHGDEVRSWGGVGGLSIPLGKRVPKWDNVRRSDLHCIGHFHQFQDLGHTLVNGSLIGYSEYAMSIGASYEPPQQMFALLDSARWKCLTAPIWVDEAA
jgi:hypothetical protein